MADTDAKQDRDEFPTARNPWTATILWARGQNSGYVSTFPNRTPVIDIVQRIESGDTISEVAADVDVPQETVQVLWRLYGDLQQVPRS